LFSLLGEEKPQPFIPLDIDRQVDGKYVISNHVSVSPPNGRLPISSNYPPNNSIPLPSHISQSHPNTITSSPPPQFVLDGGVYQGHSQTQPANWQANKKVNLFILQMNTLKKRESI
jgi:hypothetical protein